MTDKCKLIIFTILIIVSINCYVNGSTSNNQENDKKIVDNIVQLIVNHNYLELLKCFDDEVILSNIQIINKYKKSKGYDGFINKNGLLYAIIFDVEKSDDKWKSIIKREKFISFFEVFKRNKVNFSSEDKFIRVAVMIDSFYYYQIIIKRLSNTRYYVSEFSFDTL